MPDFIWRITVSIAILLLTPIVSYSQVDSTSTESGSITNCSGNLTEAKNLYDTGRISGVPGLLSECILLRRYSTRQDEVEATNLVALTYIIQDNEKFAREWIRRLIRINPKYKTRPGEVTSTYQSIFRKEKRRRWMYRIVPATVATGTAIYFLTRPPDPVLLDLPPPSPSAIP